jgi:prevent-host-death family protein
MTTTTYSIAEARDKFAALIHQVETGTEPVRVTRRGEPVALILSLEAYEQLTVPTARQRDFSEAYQAWRERWAVEEWDDEFDPFADVRDRTYTGPEVELWGE